MHCCVLAFSLPLSSLLHYSLRFLCFFSFSFFIYYFLFFLLLHIFFLLFLFFSYFFCLFSPFLILFLVAFFSLHLPFTPPLSFSLYFPFFSYYSSRYHPCSSTYSTPPSILNNLLLYFISLLHLLHVYFWWIAILTQVFVSKTSSFKDRWALASPVLDTSWIFKIIKHLFKIKQCLIINNFHLGHQKKKKMN